MTTERWWEAASILERWNGVFQGGGAKGVAYVGALRAVAEHRCWFQAVAGSSAGAITACLIAAGLSPAELEARSAEGLASLRKARWWHHVDAIMGADRPLYETSALRDWLEGLLRGQVARLRGPRVDIETDVTFAELFDATGIDLFVVVLDADGGTPVVLNHTNAPETQVSWAVVASSAIPGALPKQALVMGGDGEHWRQSRIFDGGAWANYPRFIFADASFRAFRHLDAVPDTVRTVGFVLKAASEDPALLLDRPGQFVGETEVKSRLPKREMPGGKLQRFCAALGLGLAFAAMLGVLFAGHPLYSWEGAAWQAAVALPLLIIGRKSILPVLIDFLGFLAGGRMVRVILLGAIALCFGLSLWALHELRDLFGLRPAGDDPLAGLWTPVTFFLMLALPAAIAIVAGLLLVTFRFQTFLLFDATSVLGASLGAAVKVPVWAGAGPGDHVIVVPVSPAVRTTDFELPPEQRSAVISNAYEAATVRVAQILAVEPAESSSPELPAPAPARLPGPADFSPPPGPGGGLIAAGYFSLMASIFVGAFTYLLWENLRVGVGDQVTFNIALIVAACLVVGGSILVWLGRRRSRAPREHPTGSPIS
ncbi:MULTISPECIES: patatin-like phospholipase family protein [unclassified Microbacterium]|uniref:patatin-like phospholipase family protein n=1 Tax=unclassified Microbacterium TaxID=2609290 RepID=UPI00214B4FE0|nr:MULTISPECIES: patatin-like phospholipase family protein [unclassified Microbacterium]MCR2786124.1 patatin-like phospholipase family protein [Microbacterium sp. zg.B96]WIM17037.1 patatin-like phospholipase family protein [Microbacterium sp. zg-B96]